ncbi:hypothetical protein CEXT_640771 [Caerostris extrusa]|uniref:Uncharacterized protein n=1 Tax=Caerostris extrusa TaxID=172846 RepID=A0AAV4MV65_CAEEX|nr:hypothetical protein CEXT_640771 [Caerostris extrusa]
MALDLWIITQPSLNRKKQRISSKANQEQNFQKMQESADDRLVSGGHIGTTSDAWSFFSFLFYVLSKSSSDRWAVLSRWLNVTCSKQDRAPNTM